MTYTILTSASGLTLLGGGELCTGDLSEALSIAPDLVAADGGATAALTEGYIPRAVIGDMDSIPDNVRGRIPQEALHLVAEQDSTDFDKVLCRVAGPFALGLGFLGGRIDHQLASLNSLARLRRFPCLLVGRHDIVFAAPPEIELNLPARSRVSLFPLAALRGQSDGLTWPIGGLELAPWDRHGTSNRVADAAGPVRMSFEAPGMLVILPRSALTAALSALRAAPPWPTFAPEG